jgi:hypothetical protein
MDRASIRQNRHVRALAPISTAERVTGIAAFALAIVGQLLALPTAAADDLKGPVAKAPFQAEQLDFFELRVRPVLADNCIKCHGTKKQSSGLRLDSRDAVLKGGDNGPAVVAGKPDESLLIQAVAHTHEELKMPPSGKLSEPAVAILRQWVAEGAPWPTASTGKPGSAAQADQAPANGAAQWAFQPVRQPALPAVKDRTWIRTPVDRYVLAQLERAGIAPSPRADQRTLIRRATIDLWGIPPTPEEVDRFVADSAPDAFERLVDRLLASPRYGERWGRHWLDVARYADTKGYVFVQDRRYPYAYTYRDYVISAFNSDLPFDQFVREQLAADRLVNGDDRRALAAMGFLTVGRRFLLDQNEIIDDRIDVVCRGFLGLTVTCARCHDHKFDPIPTDDYYSLYGVFASSVEPDDLPLLSSRGSTTQVADYERKLAEAIKARDDYLAARRNDFLGDIQSRLSQYFSAAASLDFDPRSRLFDERARAAGLSTRRLRGVMRLWKNGISSASAATDPVLGPWHAFAALPSAGFALKAAEVQRALAESKDPKAAKVHPLVLKVVLGSPPSAMSAVVDRYAALFAELESRLRKLRRSSGDGAASLAEPEWESLRQALFEKGGVLAVGPEQSRLFLDQTQGNRLAQYNGVIQELNSTHPAAPARAMVLNDAAKPVDPHVFVRGNPGRPGKAVLRQFLQVVAGPDRKAFASGSGRLDLAQAIADSRNPLTARVLVNRVWQWHFGKGLVTTPSDFGLRSDPPSHPALLDDLALSLMNSGWSIKSLHHRIMLSSTYQQSSGPRPEALKSDPENRLLWRFNRQRLDFEAMRDSVLAVSGALGPGFGGPSSPLTSPAFATRRTVYGLIDRQNLDGTYRTFDFAVPDATSPRRFVTTVPQQALFLMNSPFLHEQARKLTAGVGPKQTQPSAAAPGGPNADRADIVRRLYRRVLSRLPDTDELTLALGFIDRESQSSPGDAVSSRPGRFGRAEPRLVPWEQLSQVLLLTNEFMFVD